MIFLDEEESARRAAKAARASGAKLVIALSHAGFHVDVRMARQVEELDLIIGGHSHSLLYTGKSFSGNPSHGWGSRKRNRLYLSLFFIEP